LVRAAEFAGRARKTANSRHRIARLGRFSAHRADEHVDCAPADSCVRLSAYCRFGLSRHDMSCQQSTFLGCVRRQMTGRAANWVARWRGWILFRSEPLRCGHVSGATLRRHACLWAEESEMWRSEEG
jgi:hypothetical protein